MMQAIEIIVDDNKYQIEWALSEHFDELKGKKYMLNKVAADQIVMINDLSEIAKILLSAVAVKYANVAPIIATTNVATPITA
jgi:hypothetical protein